MAKTWGIIQARTSSTRLPGKAMAEIAGQPMLYHVVNRAQGARSLDQVVVATTTNQADDVLAHYCGESGIACFRGSENDVLDRYYQAARHLKAEIVVRLTADCPLIDAAVVDKVVNVFHGGNFDYVSNTLKCTYPDGLDTEVIRVAALERAWNEAKLKSEREHVTPYIVKHPELFRLKNVEHIEDLSAYRWTVDEPEDLAFVRAVYSNFGSRPFDMGDVLALLQKLTDLKDVNAGFERNEGYQKSLREDSGME